MNSQESKLTAIFSTDLAGYSRLMGADEFGTVRRLQECRKVIDESISKSGGRIANTAGDSVLAEFPSALAALQCAIAIQDTLKDLQAAEIGSADRAMRFRIGLHVGEVLVAGNDILGDGVNVAARLQSIADPGGIVVSAQFYEHVRRKVELKVADLGTPDLKNISPPVHAYNIELNIPPPPQGAPAPYFVADQTTAKKATITPTLPDQPSIAVLPFQNLSGDPEQEYFADGMVEDIITALSRFKFLFVIARNSSFTYKGRPVSIKQVGSELGVRYVLEGSVRKAGNKVRITGQLIDASTDAHVWADKFDGGLEDVFTLQDQVTSAVVSAIAPAIEKAEYEKRRVKPTEDMESYDWYLRGNAELRQLSVEGVREGLRCFERAIDLDPSFAAAWAMAAWAHLRLRSHSIANISDDALDRAETNRLARRAIELGANDALALATAGHALAYVVNDYEGAKEPAARALSLNPNLSLAWYCSGWIHILAGDGEEGLEKFQHAMRLSPLDPYMVGLLMGSSWACFLARRYNDGLNYAEASLRHLRGSHNCGALAANAFRLGDTELARKAVQWWRELDPTVTLKSVPVIFPVRGTFREEICDILRECGMPE